jgi:outer membrane receptor protein involved in Fe transport
MSACKTRYHQGHIFKTKSGIAILTGLLATSTTYAQTAAAPATAPTDELTEIIVTAQKRSESLLSTAAPVTALTAADLTRQADVKLSDYAAEVPGLNLISSGGQTSIILRGITTGYGAATSATAGTYLDDAPYGSATANGLGAVATLDVDPGVLERIEVLRGPQGTLYGADALGGLVKYVTALPSLTNYRGRVELDGSSIDGGGQGGGVRVMFDGPLVEGKLGMSISAFNRFDPGYIDDPLLNKKNVNSDRVDGGRLALLWRPTDQFSAELSVVLQDTFNNGAATVDMNSNLTPIYGKYEHARHGDEVWDPHDRDYSLHLDYDFGWADLTSISTYQTERALWTYDLTYSRGATLSKDTGIPNLGVLEHVVLDHHKGTQEIRLASPASDKLEWLGGLFYTHEWAPRMKTSGPLALQPSNL